VSENQASQIDRSGRIGFALLMSTVAAVAMGMGTGNVGIAAVVGFAVFLIFGLELS
jgi:hypothetical protein